MDELGASRRRQGLEAVVGAASISSKVTRGPWCLGQTCRLGLGHAPFEHNDETLYATGTDSARDLRLDDGPDSPTIGAPLVQRLLKVSHIHLSPTRVDLSVTTPYS